MTDINETDLAGPKQIAALKEKYCDECGLFGTEPDMATAECKSCRSEDHIMWEMCRKIHDRAKGEDGEVPPETSADPPPADTLLASADLVPPPPTPPADPSPVDPPAEPTPARFKLREAVAGIILALGAGEHTTGDVKREFLKQYPSPTSMAALQTTVGYGISFAAAFGVITRNGRRFRLREGVGGGTM